MSGHNLLRIHIFVFALFLMSCPALAQTSLSYAVHIDKEPVGSLSVNYKPVGEDLNVIEQTLDINVPGVLGDNSLQSALSETHKVGGKLIKADNKVTENDKVYWTKIELFGDEFLVSRSELTNDQQKEDAEAVDMAKGVVAYLLPGAGNVMMIGEVLLTDDKDLPKNNRLTQNSFDTSFLNLPYVWQKHDQSFPKSLRIFDTENAYIFSADVTYAGDETLTISDQTFNAKRYTINVKDADPTDIWLMADDNDTPYFLKITGKDNGDDYQVILSLEKQEN